MAPVHLTKGKVETIIAGLTPICRREIEKSLDSQQELTGECKIEIQSMLRDVSGVNPSEGTSKRMKMNSPPPSIDSTPPEMFGGETPMALNTFFDVTVLLTSVVAVFVAMWYLFGSGRRSSGDSAKKTSSELSTRKLLVKAQRRK